jgi:hypothetical protein
MEIIKIIYKTYNRRDKNWQNVGEERMSPAMITLYERANSFQIDLESYSCDSYEILSSLSGVAYVEMKVSRESNSLKL